jgi:hypothetical protein
MGEKLEKINWVQGAGLFLTVEGMLSMAISPDKSPISQLSRVVRIIIGVGLVVIKIG